MADKIYKVRDPSGNIREIKGPEGASDEEVIAQAQRLFGDTAPSAPAASTAPQTPSEVPGPRTGVPEWGQRNPVLYGIAGAARESLGPLLQAGAGIAGGLTGATTGPVGAVAGGALGYGMGTQALRAIDIALGNVAPGTVRQEAMGAAGDVATGAAMEMGGRIAGQVVGAVAPSASRLVQSIRSPKTFVQNKASDIARRAAGTDLPEILNALRQAPQGLTAAQAAAPVWSPTTQAAMARAAQYSPSQLTGGGAPGVTEAQRVTAENVLAQMAGGGTQTAARGATEAAKEGLSKTLWPVGKANLIAAGVGNRVVPRLTAQAEGFLGLAGQSYDDIAAMQSRIKLGQMPASAASDAAQMAGKLTTEAQHAMDTLKVLNDSGFKPLKSDAVLQKISDLAKDPKYAGLTEMNTALNDIGKEIRRWTTQDGLINPLAMESIRKHAVNSAVTRLLGNASPTLQQELAGKLTASVRPIIVDAIEQAGGKGYGAYLKQYSEGLQEVAKQKLSAEAMRLYKDSPDQFVKLVQGESPDVVEKFLGPGNYNLGTELAQDALTKLRTIADVTQRGARAVEQAGKGQEAYRQLLVDNIPRIKLPWGLSPSGAAINKGLDILEKKLGTKIMKEIAEASKTAESYEQLLSRMPKSSASKLQQALSTDPSLNRAVATQAVNATVNAFADRENRNALND